VGRAVPTEGQEAVVAAAVATVWSSPDAPRAIDAPALADTADIRNWVTGMNVEALNDLGGRTLSQLLLGERVLVEEIDGDWAKIIAVQQPAAKLDPRGYPGYVRRAHLTVPPSGPSGAREIVVDATATTLRDGPNGDVMLYGVMIGTRLRVVGAPQRGWVPVSAPGIESTVWIRDADVAPAPTSPPSAKDVLAVADRLLDVPYVWGGLSAYGIDCSGLVHLAHRRLGVRVPRDADDQAGASEQLKLGTEQPGDLYFFARPGRAVHHVGVVAASAAGTDDDPRRMVHASGYDSEGRVVSEPMPADRVATLAGTHRTLS
jgi:cell wall-associated NlpC family hydrolase